MDCRVKDEDEEGNMRIPQKHVSLEKHGRIVNKGGLAIIYLDYGGSSPHLRITVGRSRT
jgi:hypothetical protein